MTRPVDPRELRKLNAALGLGGLGDHAGRLIVAVLAIVLTLAALALTVVPIGRPTKATA